ncbi:MAG TPA: VCBS repeat-containing protein [Candidatus Hydrogenedentes bacterium]|nr:VCBS repeat-containing protein [Candidatus Hydrogenedentota bacterium]
MRGITALLLATLAAAVPAVELRFDRERIGTGTYEAAAAFDVNNDGVIDIVSGCYWYAGPDFRTAHTVCDLQPVDTYYDDFSNYPLDVNGDGYLDIVNGAWWGMRLEWRENPKGQAGLWTTHEVAKVGNVERNVFCDFDGDGIPEVFPVTKPVHIFKLERDADGKGTGKFLQYTIDKGTGGHGLGTGDVNGDGRTDIVLSGGWLESPADPFDVEGWVWHAKFNLGSASVPILVHDVNNDGLNDLIVGEAHNYGLYWMEQGRDENGDRTWTKHMVEEHRSQFHDLQLHDIDNDGELELVTGKRYRAHNGHDPGADDPVGVYYYEINGGAFDRVTLDYGPADNASGVGIYFWVADVTGNGWKDIIAPGKEGLYLFRNMGPAAKD